MTNTTDEADPIRRRMESLSVEELIRVVGEDADDWQPEAQAIARQELARRGVANIPTPDPALKARQETSRRAAAARNGWGHMLVGGAVCVAGLGVTVATYSAATEQGGHYIIAWGAILFGFLQFVRGFLAWVDRNRPVAAQKNAKSQ